MRISNFLLKSFVFLSGTFLLVSPFRADLRERHADIDNSWDSFLNSNAEIASIKRSEQVVIVIGKGSSIQNASINAAQNALIQVLGSFVDSDTLITKQKILTSKLSQSTKNISRSLNTYSKGSIAAFEVLDTMKRDSFFTVTAKVTVRLKDLNRTFNFRENNNSERLSTDLEKVFASGVGKTEDLALKNAAENALFQVAGSYIDRDKLVKKRKVIQNGIISSSQNISTNLRQYSKGYIKKIDVIKLIQKGSLFKVLTVIYVQKNDFSPYVKKLAGDTVTVNPGLFDSILKDSADQLSKTKQVLHLLKPIEDGTAFRIAEGKVQTLSQYVSSADCRSVIDIYNSKVDRYDRSYYTRMHTECLHDTSRYSGFDRLSTIVIPFSISLDLNFKHHLIETLSRLEDKDIKEIPHHRSKRGTTYQDGLEIVFYDREARERQTFLFRDLRMHLRNSIKDHCHPFLRYERLCDRDEEKQRLASDALFLQITFFDSSKVILRKMKLPVNKRSAFVRPINDSCYGYDTVQGADRLCKCVECKGIKDVTAFRRAESRHICKTDINKFETLSLARLSTVRSYNCNSYKPQISSHRNFLLVFDNSIVPLSRLASVSLQYVR